MAFGLLNSILLGSAMPLMVVVFGEMTDMFVYSEAWSNWVSWLYDTTNVTLYTNVTEEELLEDPSLLE